MKTLLLSTIVALGLAASAAPAAAQTTSTTIPPVRSIPVTPAPTVATTAAPTTTTTAPKVTTTAPTAAATAGTETAAPPVAVTGISADKLVPFGLLLIGLGAVLTNAARRLGRIRYNFL